MVAKIQKEKRQKHAGTKNPIEVCPSVYLYLPLPPTKDASNPILVRYRFKQAE
ncbi:hypothetical protein HMPREF9442_02728 [Paraprevotella xylaniphila YIT 11841]|uniref:Uncharacterized protein n=1 Tax=Paraprevotella xylaniphila YIT 11841 TaxID=762982 RepID=F3QWZ3_9BACT|nr:hypothetical protein HMPREF9442_02728 [Paraprevotella xylaniphila YIT 11841]